MLSSDKLINFLMQQQWIMKERLLKRTTIVKIYETVIDGKTVIFDDNEGVIYTVGVGYRIELNKQQYRNLNHYIVNQIEQKTEEVLERIYNKLKEKV